MFPIYSTSWYCSTTRAAFPPITQNSAGKAAVYPLTYHKSCSGVDKDNGNGRGEHPNPDSHTFITCRQHVKDLNACKNNCTDCGEALRALALNLHYCK